MQKYVLDELDNRKENWNMIKLSLGALIPSRDQNQDRDGDFLTCQNQLLKPVEIKFWNLSRFSQLSKHTFVLPWLRF